MSIAWISLVALLAAVTLSMFTKVNVGIVSLALAWIVGVYIGGLPLNTVIGAFPIQLFLTLTGVTLLFGMAHVNGTLERLAARAVSLCYGNAGIIPLMFFLVALVLSTIGPGNIATAALLAPMAMAIGHRAGVPPFLMILMVGNGAQAGALSPFAPTGVIVNGVMARIGLAGVEWQTYANNLFAHFVITFVAYFAFGGWRLFARRGHTETRAEVVGDARAIRPGSHWLTMAVLAMLVIRRRCVRHAGRDGGAHGRDDSLAGRCRRREGDDQADALERRPDGLWRHRAYWCSGTDARHGLVHRPAGARVDAGDGHGGDRVRDRHRVGLQQHVWRSAAGISADRAGVGGAPRWRRPLAIASAMNVGGHLVDLSPLSTIGALCLAALPPTTDAVRCSISFWRGACR